MTNTEIRYQMRREFVITGGHGTSSPVGEYRYIKYLQQNINGEWQDVPTVMEKIS